MLYLRFTGSACWRSHVPLSNRNSLFLAANRALIPLFSFSPLILGCFRANSGISIRLAPYFIPHLRFSGMRIRLVLADGPSFRYLCLTTAKSTYVKKEEKRLYRTVSLLSCLLSYLVALDARRFICCLGRFGTS